MRDYKSEHWNTRGILRLERLGYDVPNLRQCLWIDTPVSPRAEDFRIGFVELRPMAPAT